MNKYFILAHNNAVRIKFRKNKRKAARTILNQLSDGLAENIKKGMQ